jgi:hypothetical protein
MSDSIADVLGSRRYEEPDELSVVRKFVQDNFDETPKLKITQNSIVITVSSAALAGALRPHLHKLKAKVKTDKNLLIRID